VSPRRRVGAIDRRALARSCCCPFAPPTGRHCPWPRDRARHPLGMPVPRRGTGISHPSTPFAPAANGADSDSLEETKRWGIAVKQRSIIRIGLTMSDHDHTRMRFLSFRVPETLFAVITADAMRLGVSIADACRFRLRTGHVPTIPDRAPAEEWR
jgi:hypothetical protein